MDILQVKQSVQQEQDQLKTILADVIAKGQKKVDAIEVAINKSTGINVSTLRGETENVEFNSDGALGITVYQNNQKGSVSTNDLSPLAIEQALDMAINIMKYTSPDPCSGLADKDQMAFECADLDLFHPSALDVDFALKLASEAEKSALAHPNVKESDGGHFNSGYGVVVYGNSHGMLQSFCESSHSLSCSVIAEQNGQMERDYAYTSSRIMEQLLTPKWVGEEAAKRTVAMLGAKNIKTMQVPVMFAPEVAISLFKHLVSAISGGAIYKKQSFLLDKLGEKIFPDWLTIKEYPHILQGVGSIPFDREGVKTVNKTIIDKGVLDTYLLSSYSARQLSTPSQVYKSTGNAGGIYNWRLEAVKPLLSFDEMVKTLDKGIIVTSLMGQGVNPVTGDYSRGAKGFWVEHGQIQYPITEFTVAGNLNDIYQQIVAIGSDTETRTNIQSGSLLIEKMSVAGR
ncbi:metalloprotease PmbA [Orbaceae bacterium ac157xtp]